MNPTKSEKRYKSSFAVISSCLIVAVFCLIGVSSLAAQQTLSSPDLSAKFKADKKRIDKIINSQKDQPFVLLTPSDLAGYSKNEVAAMLGTDPCETAERIEFGQQIVGELTATDCRLEDGSYADFYFFDALAGEHANITLASGTYFPYLGLANESGTFVIEDAGVPGERIPTIDTDLPETGMYLILSNSVFADEFGTYYLKLTGGPTCDYVFTPSSADIPGTAGTYSFNVAVGPRCYWTAGGAEFYVTTNSSGLGNGTVTYNVEANPVNQIRQTSIRVGNAFFNIRQAACPCTYTLNPTSVNVGVFQSTGSFTVTAPSGCFWSASDGSTFVSATGSANGSGTVNYTVQHNNGAARSGTVRIYDQTFTGPVFTVNQAGLNCTYSVTPTQMRIPAASFTVPYTINTQAGCTWSIYNSIPWIDQPQSMLGTGPATMQMHVQALTGGSQRSGGFLFQWGANDISNSISTFVEQSVSPSPVAISGRVTTPSGVGLRNAVVTLTDSAGIRQTATTSTFGFYQFASVAPADTYTISVSSRRYRFAPQTMQVLDSMSNLDFVGLE